MKWATLVGLFQEPFDFKNIKSHCNRFIFVHSDDDPYVPLKHAEYLSNELNGELNIIKNQGHFNIEASPGFKQFPRLLEIIESIK
ncbi:hypothetical protein D9M69_679370 [compost metagenome]